MYDTIMENKIVLKSDIKNEQITDQNLQELVDFCMPSIWAYIDNFCDGQNENTTIIINRREKDSSDKH